MKLKTRINELREIERRAPFYIRVIDPAKLSGVAFMSLWTRLRQLLCRHRYTKIYKSLYTGHVCFKCNHAFVIRNEAISESNSEDN